jgi:C-terminal processing protease CtpA/Prc
VVLINYKMNRRFLVVLFAVSALTFGACKKNKVEPNPTPDPPVTPPTTTATRQQLSLDSIFLYAKEVYYWNEKLPTYAAFNPRQYSSLSTDLLNYEKALFEITKYSNPGEWKSGATSSKFSYISDKTTENPSTTGFVLDKSLAVNLEGNGNDIGLRVVPYLTNSTTRSYLLFVTAVYDKSPAMLAGMKRGMVITKVNGTAIGAHYENERTNLNSQLGQNVVNLEGRGYIDNVTFTKSLTKAVYTKSSPVYAQKVYNTGSKKIGYFAMARFSRLSTASTNNPADVNLDAAFAEFSNKGVTDLIIDLRYNGGGYIQTAEHLINLIAPTSTNGKVMFSEHYNNTMQNNQATILQHQAIPDENGKAQFFNGKLVTYFDYKTNPYSLANNTVNFRKKGSLDGIQNVVFLVTGNTASASELVINSLKPYLNVKVVGATTYGKPIGFFPIVIENRYKVYFSMFDTRNSLGQGAYYDGIKPDPAYDEDLDASGDIWDDPRYDFGDVKEGYLAAALKILAPGATITTEKARATMSVQGQTISVKNLQKMAPVKDDSFVGMIEDRHGKK